MLPVDDLFGWLRIRGGMKQISHRSSARNTSVKPVSPLQVEPLIEPWLKDFLDRVVIPALLREFMKRDLATSGGIAAQSHQEAPKGELE